MSAIPTYKAAVAGQPGNAGMANQFLGAHPTTLVYDDATLQASRTTGSAVYTTTESQYVSQSFLTGASQTTISQVWLQVSVVGGHALTNTIAPFTLSLYASDAGQPTGSPLASTSLSETAIYAAPFWVVFPLVASGLTASTTYHLVSSPAGTSSTYYVWQDSDQASGASLSPDLVAWTDQTYGLMYQVYDQTTSTNGNLTYVVMDGGDRWIRYTYDSHGLIATVTEYAVNQSGVGSLNNTRTLTYSNGLLTGVN